MVTALMQPIDRHWAVNLSTQFNTTFDMSVEDAKNRNLQEDLSMEEHVDSERDALVEEHETKLNEACSFQGYRYLVS